jgi:hypothetical protein
MVFVAATRARAQAVETFEYTVVPGDSCGRIAQRFYGAWRRFDVILRFNPRLTEGVQRGACGPFLRPGVVLTLPTVYVDGGPTAAPSTPDPDARVVRTVRDVQAAEPEARWERASRGQALWRGWRVNTLERSAADVTFRDASRIALRENTLIVIYGAGASTARRETSRATLERGHLRSRLAELRLEVETPTGLAELATGSALVGVDAEGTTRVSNFEGDPASVRGRRGRVAVREGFGSKVVRGARPSRPRPLPPAPTWLEGPRRFVGLAPYGATVVGSWSAVEVARRYRVEVVDGEGDIVAATEVPAEVTRFELHQFPEGSYRVRVSTIDGDFFESRPSDARELEVAFGRLNVPTDEVAPDPSDEPAPPSVVLGARFQAPDGVVCSLGGEAGRELVFSQVGPQEVRCVDDDGRPTGTYAVSVEAPALTLEIPELVRGQTARVLVRSDSPLPVGLRLRGDGIDAPLEPRDGVWVASFETEESPSEQSITVVAGEVVLGEHDVRISEAPEDAVPVPAEAATEPEGPEPVLARPPTPFAAISHPDLVALRDAPGDDLAVSIGLGSLGDHPGRDAHLRLDALVAGTLAERVRVAAGIVRDFAEIGDRAVPRGDGDLRFEIDGTSRSAGPWRLGGGATLFAPTGRRMLEARTLDTFRVGGQVDVDYVRGTFAVRTRQGALVDSSAGLRAWVSTYGASWRAHDQISLGAEAQLTLGRDSATDQLVVLATVGLGTELRFGGSAFVLGARVGLGDDAWTRVGAVTLALGWRVSFDETMP